MKWLFLLLLPAFSFAQNCSQINYLTAANSPFEKIPVVDQDGTGICYAITGAHLMNYHLIRSNQASDQVVHPIWAALKSSRRRLDLGFEHAAINLTNRDGICDYSRVEGALNAFSSGSGLTGNPLVGFLETYANEMERTDRESAFYTAQDVAYDNCNEDIIWERLEPQLAKLSGTSVQIFTQLFAQECGPGNIRRYSFPSGILHVVQNYEDASTKLALLRNGPMAVSYCGASWNHPQYFGQNSPRNYGPPLADCGDHSSLAVGRKMIGGSCHILVRNSWGTGWGDWNSNRTCLCRHKVTRRWVDECNASDHSPDEYTVEACYMGRSQLEKNLTSVTTL